MAGRIDTFQSSPKKGFTSTSSGSPLHFIHSSYMYTPPERRGVGFNATSLHSCIHFVSPPPEAGPPALVRRAGCKPFTLTFNTTSPHHCWALCELPFTKTPQIKQNKKKLKRGTTIAFLSWPSYSVGYPLPPPRPASIRVNADWLHWAGLQAAS